MTTNFFFHFQIQCCFPFCCFRSKQRPVTSGLLSTLLKVPLQGGARCWATWTYCRDTQALVISPDSKQSHADRSGLPGNQAAFKQHLLILDQQPGLTVKSLMDRCCGETARSDCDTLCARTKQRSYFNSDGFVTFFTKVKRCQKYQHTDLFKHSRNIGIIDYAFYPSFSLTKG